MSMDYEMSITQLKENLEKAKGLKFRAEAKLEQLNKQREEIIREIKSMGLEPENIDREIEKLQQEIEKLLSKSQEMLPTMDGQDE